MDRLHQETLELQQQAAREAEAAASLQSNLQVQIQELSAQAAAGQEASAGLQAQLGRTAPLLRLVRVCNRALE